MDKTIKLPKTKVTLLISGKKLILDDVSKLLKIEPTKIRREKEWPKAIRDNKNLPEEYQPRNEWSYSIERSQSYETQLIVKELIQIFDLKREVLGKLNMKHGVQLNLVLSIQISDMEVPHISFDMDTLSFCQQCGIELIVNLYDSDSN